MSASRSRSRGGLRLGLLVCTVVVLTAACGSIDVVTGDAGGGSGGTVGGGMGGIHGGGTGGMQGSGGITGTGGTNRGSGGMSGGSGGTTGSGGSGGAGGSGPSCTQLQKAFVAALADAKMCVLGGSGYCGVVTSDKLDCGCPTHVNDTKNIDPIRTEWAQSGCGGGLCPQIACIAYKSAICAVPSGSTAAVCQDQATLPTP